MTPTTNNNMGSPATKLAAELAETMREPTGADGRSVNWTLPTANPSASSKDASPAPRRTKAP